MTDRERENKLLKRLVRGRDERTLFFELDRIVRSLVARRGGPRRLDRGALVNDALLTLYRRRRTLRRIRDFHAWIGRVIRSRFCDGLRRPRRRFVALDVLF